MKKPVEPTTAPNAIIGFRPSASQTIAVRMIEAIAKNQTPLDAMNRSPRSPKFFCSRKSQWRNNRIRNVPPPIRRIGADCSIASSTSGSLENVAKNAPTGPSARCGQPYDEPGVAGHGWRKPRLITPIPKTIAVPVHSWLRGLRH